MKKLFLLLILLCSLNFNLISSTKLTDGIYAKFLTNKGTITCKLFYKKVGRTVSNFIGLAEGKIPFFDFKLKKNVMRPFYNGLIFHRVISNFMIQGGCPFGTGTGSPGYKFNDEFVAGLVHNKPGILSMANSGPNTNGSQFFITLVPTPWLNNKHTVFGEVVEGMDVVKKIGAVKVNMRKKPLQNVTITELKIIRIGKEAELFDPVKYIEAYDAQNNKKINAFSENLKKDIENAVTTPSGLKYIVIKKGSGIKPEKGQRIGAHYTGYLMDGTKFDSSVDRGKPFFTFIGIGRVIKGWDEAFLDMHVGEKRRLIIPPHLGYGNRSIGPIPANSTLIFDVELLNVNNKSR